MVYKASVVPVMIASPSDVIEQRNDIRNIVNNWNFVHGYSRSLILMPIGRETHSAPDLGGRAQDLINDRLLEDCDLLVWVFWTKLGTPTGDFESGTVEEITRHVEAGKPAMIYFSDAPVAPQLIDASAFEKVQKFKEWCYEKGLVAVFSNPEEFRRKFETQLQINLNSNPYLKGIIDQFDVISRPDHVVVEISDDAKELLLAINEDPSGHLMTYRTLSGNHIQVNGHSYGDPGSARSSARWRAAVEELVTLRYIVSIGSKGEVFQMTDAGYKCVDRINQEVSDVQRG